MFFWILAGLLTLAACMAVMLPFLRAARQVQPADAHDGEVYRQQLAEITEDLRRGTIAQAEAEQARAEIGRRLLEADRAQFTRTGSAKATRGRMVASVAVLAVPLLTWSIYAWTGSPQLPDQRLADRMSQDPSQSSAEELIARAEEHLGRNPDDGRGWDVLAPIYLRMGRAEDAANAFRQSIRINGSSGDREAGLGHALVESAEGVVRPEAREALDRALRMDPANAQALFYTALAEAQAGNAGVARELLGRIVAAQPQGSPWHSAASRGIERLGTQTPVADGQAPNEDVSADAFVDADADAMIEEMVSGLDARLRENPDDAEGWERLMRSHMVLGRRDDALDALRRGLTAFDHDAATQTRLREFAGSVGLEEETQ